MYTPLSSLSMGHPLTTQSTTVPTPSALAPPLAISLTKSLHFVPSIHCERSLEGVWRPYICPLHSIPKTILTLITFPRFGSLHCWVHFVHEGDITSEDSIKETDMPLCNELVYSHQQKGTWLQLPYYALLCLISSIRHNKA